MNSEIEMSMTDENTPLGYSNKEDTWIVESDLDSFFTELYNYYISGGIGSIISQRLSDIATTAFTIIVPTVLFTSFDFDKLLESNDISFSNYLYNPFMNMNMFKLFVFSISFTTLLYLLYLIISSIQIITKAYKTRLFYKIRLNMSTNDIQTCEWSDVVQKIKHLQDSGYTLQINNAELNALTISQRIMRRDNYMIALINKNVLPIGSPFWKDSSEEYWLSQILEYNLYLAFLNNLVNNNFEINQKIINVNSIRTRFYILAIVNTLLMPAILIFSVIHFFFKYAEEFHSKKNYLGPRFWSQHALWSIREYNEMPHHFNKRVYSSLKRSEKFLRLFPIPVPVIIARCSAFILGSFVSVLLLFGLINDFSLLHIKIYGKNLLWYFAIFSTLLASARSFIPMSDEEYISHSEQLHKISEIIHYDWKGDPGSYSTRDKFSAMFPYRVVLLFRELISVVCTPYILAVVFPKRSKDIVNFIKDNTIYISGIGDVCAFSTLSQTINREKDIKMEKSFHYFKEKYDNRYSGIFEESFT